MLSITLRHIVTGEEIADLTPRISGAQFSDNEHGFERFDGFYPCSLQESFRLWQYRGAGWVRVTWNGYTAWEGRMEDPRIVDGGIQIGALGPVRAFYDLPYTAAWSKTKNENFFTVPETISSQNPQQFDVSPASGGLFVGLKKNEAYANNSSIVLYTPIPHNSSNKWAWLQCDYSYFVPAGWVIRGVGLDTSYASATTSNITTTGSAGSGAFTWNLSASAREYVGFQIYNGAGSTVTYTGDTGGSAGGYVRFSNIRATTSGSTIYANEIFSSLVSTINALNSSQLQNVTALVSSPAIDLYNEVYEDEYPADIANKLAAYGGSSGSLWEWGVWEDRIPYFRQRSSAARTWYIDAASIDLDGSIENLRNSAYAVYQDAAGLVQRSSTSTNSQSVTQFGLTRRDALRTDTTNSGQAASLLSAFLNDRQNPKPRVAFTFDRLFDSSGAQYPLFMLRSGDTLVARNLPPTLSTDIDRIRSFRVSRKTYDIDANVLTCEPEDPPPSLDVLIARMGNAR